MEGYILELAQCSRGSDSPEPNILFGVILSVFYTE